jgi:hypothetical protein
MPQSTCPQSVMNTTTSIGSKIPSLTGAGKLTRLLLRDQEIEPKSLPASQVLAKSAQLDSVTYGELDADLVEVPQLLDIPASVISDTLSTELESMVSTAQKNGMPSQDVPTLRHLVNEFTDIWSTSLQAGPPATLPPMVIRLKPDAVSVHVRLLRYRQEQHDFLALFVKILEEAGMVYINPSAAWCSAPLLVTKPGPAQFRFTVDLRPVNKQTIPCSWPMPHVELELSRLQYSKCFCDVRLESWLLASPARSRVTRVPVLHHPERRLLSDPRPPWHNQHLFLYSSGVARRIFAAIQKRPSVAL